jgi:hypothetical protein
MTGHRTTHDARRRGLVVGLAVFATLCVFVWALFSTGDRPREARTRSRGEANRTASTVGAGGVDTRGASSAARRVLGTVRDTDGQPVREGVLSFVCLDPRTGEVTTIAETVVIGEEGKFDAPACRGITCVRLAHPALVPASPWLLDGAGEASSGATATTEFVARPLLTTTGIVRTPEGEPAVGARVRVLPPGEDDPRAVPAFTSTSTSTDEDGAFTLFRVEHPPCDPCDEAQERCDAEVGRIAPTWPEMTLFVHAEGWPSAELRFDVENDTELEITLPRGGLELRGSLLDGDGVAYTRASILARSELRPWERASATVESDGSFVFGSLRDGPYTLRAVQDGVELVRREGVQASDEVRLVGTPSATGATVVVHVRDLEGELAADVRVSGGPFRDARTDAQGAVRADGVLPGSFTLRWGSRLENTREIAIESTSPPAGGPAPLVAVDVDLPD